MALSIVILAAGQGTRMRSQLPKVLHALAGRPLLEHVIGTALELQPEAVYVVHGHGGEQVKMRFSHYPLRWVMQAQQLGTGHAVAQALPLISALDTVLILYGDVPLITLATLRRLLDVAGVSGLGLLTAHLQQPDGYGRVLRDAGGSVQGIVEHKDADSAQRAITEINTGVMCAPCAALKTWIAALDTANAQGEYYLTDIVGMAARSGTLVRTAQPDSNDEILGVNDREQLAYLERCYQRRIAADLMRQGLTLADPERFDVRGRLSIGNDVMIDVGVIIEGDVFLGDRVRIGPYSLLRQSRLANDFEVMAHCVIEEASIGAGSRIGPFARVRPGSDLADAVSIGNFVEIKQTSLGTGSKVNHLSYIGDACIGSGVNIGAGTITCNYDGASKHRTIIEDGAFIGSDTQLVAPVTVGAGATLGAGTTLTRDAPAGMLTLSRPKQATVPGWKRPCKPNK